MNWPSHADYQDAIQNPHICFQEPELKEAEVKCDMLGLPRVMSGNFACVYEVRTGATRWAIRCFVRQVMGQQGRYARLSQHLATVDLPYLVPFEYMLKGILVRGDWFPIVKMQWVEGQPLNQFIDDHVRESELLLKLAERWCALVSSLRQHNIAHGDFQHGNVMVTGDGEFRLVDYDGMYCPAFGRGRAPELGHANFQHPRRTPEFYEEGLDNFSALVIHTTLLALAGEPELWTEFYTADDLVLSSDDFRNIHGSKVFKRFAAHKDPRVQQLGQLLQRCCLSPIDQVPCFEEVVVALEAGTLDAVLSRLAPVPDSPPAGVTEVWWDKEAEQGAKGSGSQPKPELSRPAPQITRPVEPIKTSRPAEPLSPARPSVEAARVAALQAQTQQLSRPAVQATRSAPEVSRSAEPEPPQEQSTKSAWDNTPVASTTQSTSFMGSQGNAASPRWAATTGQTQVIAAAAKPKSNTLIYALAAAIVALAGVVVVLVANNKSTPVAASIPAMSSPAVVVDSAPPVEASAPVVEPPTTTIARSSPPPVTLIGTLIEHRKGVDAVAFSPDGKWLASGSSDNSVVIWDSATRQVKHTLGGFTDGIESVTFLSGSGGFAVVDVSNNVRLFAPLTGKLKTALPRQADNLWPDVISPTGALIASGSKDRKTVRLLDGSSGAVRHSLKDHATWVIAVGFSGDGQTLATASADFTVRIWNAITGSMKHSVAVPNAASANTLGIVLAGDGASFLTVRDGKTARLWNAPSGRMIARFAGHADDVKAAGFVPGGRFVVTAGSDRTVKIWDIQTATPIVTLTGHEDAVTAVAVSNDGKRIASASADKTVKVWDSSALMAP